jgi:hypothetical protein
VLAIEVRQYVDAAGERQTIVPRVLGQTEAARSAKRATGGPGIQWDEAALLAELEAQRNDAEAGCARAILDWAKRQPGVTLWFGKSRLREWGSVQPRLDHDGAYFTPCSIWTNGGVEMLFQSMVSERRPQRPFDQEDMRRELMKRLNTIPDVDLPEKRLALRPNFPLRVLLDEGARSEFLATLEWAFGEARAP